MSQIFEYGVSALKRIRNFFVLCLSIIVERRENPIKPKDYVDPICEYDHISEVVDLIDLHIRSVKLIDKRSKKSIMTAFELASRIFHSRIMSLHNYHVETRKLIDRCNGIEKDYPTNLILRLGVGNRRAA